MKSVSGPILLLVLLNSLSPAVNGKTAALWHRYEIAFASTRDYDNPLYDVAEFSVTFLSPTGRERRVNGFWDGERAWKVRFQPDEAGEWSWKSACSDKGNRGLNGQTGRFVCSAASETLEIYRRGAIRHLPGKYHLTHADGTPFFWMGCTAWNGAMKATDADWDHYLGHRRDNNYNLIQFVTTQWRGGDSDRDGEVAFTGAGKIEINPAFFRKLDKRVDRINDHGMVAAPVLLWALPSVRGRELSPGYFLPVDEAALLASYIVARYQGNHVIWILGGDGRYFDEFESRWRKIGQLVFAGIDHAPATLHPHGNSYIGDLYADQHWYSIMGYQSSHSYQQRTVDFINRDEVASNWSMIRPMPNINMEPLYENILENQTAEHVRNAIWWSLFATPVAGITYGANGIWSWIERDGDPILNHREAPWTLSWKNSLQLPVSMEMKHLHEFFSQFRWWELFPNQELLAGQPGDEQYDAYVGVLSSPDLANVLVYMPKKGQLRLRNPLGHAYRARWFNPDLNSYSDANVDHSAGMLTTSHNAETGMVLVLSTRPF